MCIMLSPRIDTQMYVKRERERERERKRERERERSSGVRSAPAKAKPEATAPDPQVLKSLALHDETRFFCGGSGVTELPRTPSCPKPLHYPG